MAILWGPGRGVRGRRAVGLPLASAPAGSEPALLGSGFLLGAQAQAAGRRAGRGSRRVWAVNGALSASWRELRPFCSSVSLALCGSHIWRAQWRFGPGKQLAGKMRLTFPGGDPQPPVGRSCRGNWTTCVRSRCAGTQAAPPPSLADIRGVLGLKVPSSGCKETGRAS